MINKYYINVRCSGVKLLMYFCNVLKHYPVNLGLGVTLFIPSCSFPILIFILHSLRKKLPNLRLFYESQ